MDSARGWVIAVAGLILQTWSFGVFYSFGAAFDQMAEEFGSGLGATAAVFSITTALLFFMGLLSGPLADRYGARPMLLAGAVMVGTGLVLTSRVNQLELGYVTYGIGLGAGVGAYIVPMTTCVGGWFEKYRTLALGLYTGGIGLGTLVLVPVAEWLIDARGWRDAYLIMGIGSFIVFGLVAAVTTRPPGFVPPATARPDFGAIARQYGFKQLYLSGMLMSLALFVPFVFVVKYATERGVDKSLAVTLIGAIGMGSLAGRLGLGALGTRLGVRTLVLVSLGVQPVAYVIWLASAGNFAILVVFTLLLGVGYGGYVALSPVLAAELWGLQGLGSALGILYTSAGVGGLIGPIAAGVLIDATGSFTVTISVAALLSAAAVAVYFPLRRREHTAPQSNVVIPTAPLPPRSMSPTPAGIDINTDD